MGPDNELSSNDTPLLGTVERLLMVLSSKDTPAERIPAFEQLKKVADKQSVPRLIDVLQSRQFKGRAEVAEVLGMIGDDRAVPILVFTLQDPDWQVRLHAAEALGQIGHMRAVTPLIEALPQAGLLERNAIAAALVRLQDRRAIAPLVQSLGTSPPDEKARYQADPEVLQTYYQLLAQFGDDMLPALAAALHDDNSNLQEGALAVLLAMGSDGAVELLMVALEEGDETVRSMAAQALGQLADPQAVPALIAALSDPGRSQWWPRPICEEAASALEQIGTPEALDAVADWRGG
jgi:HEAT repeat protein